MKKDNDSSEEDSPKKFFDKLIFSVERVGNFLPHPFFLFIILILSVFVLSFILCQFGVSVTHFGFNNFPKQTGEKTISVVNLLQKEMLQSIMSNFVKTFAYFTPVGFVLIMILGGALTEKTGLFPAFILIKSQQKLNVCQITITFKLKSLFCYYENSCNLQQTRNQRF